MRTRPYMEFSTEEVEESGGENTCWYIIVYIIGM